MMHPPKESFRPASADTSAFFETVRPSPIGRLGAWSLATLITFALHVSLFWIVYRQPDVPPAQEVVLSPITIDLAPVLTIARSQEDNALPGPASPMIEAADPPDAAEPPKEPPPPEESRTPVDVSVPPSQAQSQPSIPDLPPPPPQVEAQSVLPPAPPEIVKTVPEPAKPLEPPKPAESAKQTDLPEPAQPAKPPEVAKPPEPEKARQQAPEKEEKPKQTLKKKAPKPQIASAASGGPKSEVGNAPVTAGRSGGSATAVSQSAVETWRNKVRGRIVKAKRYPSEARSRNEQGIAKVSVSIGPSGEVRSVKLLKSSGSTSIDEEAQAVMKRASPFPTPPDGVSQTLVIPLNFNRK